VSENKRRVHNIHDFMGENERVRARARLSISRTEELIERLKKNANKDYWKEFEEFKKRNKENK